MRELTDAELAFIAGGYDGSEDVVVTGFPGGPPPIDWFPTFPTFPTFPPVGGGGGGGEVSFPPIEVTDENGNSIKVEPTYNTSTKIGELDISVSNTVGSFTTNFDLNKFDLNSFNLTINNGSSSYSSTFNIDSSAVTGTYNLDFGGGASGSATFTTNGSTWSVGVSFKASF